MVKPNFFVTAAGLNLGLLAVSALSYWFTQNRSQQEPRDEDDSSTAQSTSTGNVSHEESSDTCGVCLQKIVLNPITTLECGHKVHGHCFYRMKNDSLTCPTCFREMRNN